jgi:DNA-binding SARP family transcriptional activator
MLEYRALAGLTIHDGDQELAVGGPRQRRLLGVLLVHRGAVVSGDVLAEAVFDGRPPPGARGTIRSYVARLRHVLDRPGAGSHLVTQPPGYRLEVGDDAFDVARFERSVTLGRSELSEGRPQEAARSLRSGLGLWHGEAYEEFADEDWARPEVARLDELRLVAHDLLAEAGLACGLSAEVAADLEPLVAEHPLRESFQAKLMIALYRSGRQADALRSYQDHRRVLAEDLGLEPEPELSELEQRILAHDDSLRGPPVHHLGVLAGEPLPDDPGTGVSGTGTRAVAAVMPDANPPTARPAATARRLSAQLAVLGIAVVIALIAGAVAVRQIDRADRAGRYAVARELAAASTANLSVDPERSILLALAAVEQTRASEGSALPEAVDALRRALRESRAVLRVPGVGGALAWAPDGATLAAEAPAGDGTVELRDARTGVVLRSFEAHIGGLRAIAFAAHGTRLVTTGADGATRVWDVETGALQLELLAPVGQGPPLAPAFDADGSLLAVAWPDRDLVEVHDVATGAVVFEVRSVPAPVSLSFAPDGSGLAVVSGIDATGVVVRIDGGHDPIPLSGPAHPLTGVAWSPDGAHIATWSREDGACIADARTGMVQLTLPSPAGIAGLVWSPDAERVVTAGTDGSATVWQVDDHVPRELLRLATQDARLGITGLTFSPDGTHVATAHAGDTALRVWDVQPVVGWLAGPGSDGRSVIDADVDELVDLARGALTRTLTDEECGRFLHVRPCP